MKRKHRKKRAVEGLSPEARTCTTKIKYANETMARMGAKKALYLSRGGIPAMWVYDCPFCDGWHTTTRSSDWPKVTV